MSLSSLARSPERILSAKRLITAMGLGVVAGVPTAVAGDPELSPIVGWIVASGVALAVVWRVIWPQDDQGTKRLAEQERHSHTSDTVVLVAAVLSFSAVGLALVQSSRRGNLATTASVVLSIAAVALSWCLVNTVFALKYARVYYLDEHGVDDPGGIDIDDNEPPTYTDFAFVAFMIGMSYGPPETKLTSRRMRRLGLAHALLAYVFGTGILAVGINLIANLAQG